MHEKETPTEGHFFDHCRHRGGTCPERADSCGRPSESGARGNPSAAWAEHLCRKRASKPLEAEIRSWQHLPHPQSGTFSEGPVPQVLPPAGRGAPSTWAEAPTKCACEVPGGRGAAVATPPDHEATRPVPESVAVPTAESLAPAAAQNFPIPSSRPLKRRPPWSRGRLGPKPCWRFLRTFR